MEKENTNIISKESISTKDFKEEGVYWSDIKNKSNNEEQSSLLRKDPVFGEKIYKKLKDLIKDEQIVDEKKIEIILNILYNILSNGKFDLENIDSNYDIKIF